MQSVSVLWYLYDLTAFASFLCYFVQYRLIMSMGARRICCRERQTQKSPPPPIAKRPTHGEKGPLLGEKTSKKGLLYSEKKLF